MNRQPSVQNKRDSIHEAGHAVLVKLFEDSFAVKTITLKPHMYASKTDVRGWRGGIQVSARKKPLSAEEVDNLIIIMWGGLCSQNIYTKGLANFNGQVINHMSVFWQQEMDLEGCEGDFEFSSPDIETMSRQRGLSRGEFEMLVVHFILTFQSHPEVWRAIEALSKKILNKGNLTVDSTEVEVCFKESGLHDFLMQSRKSILSTRYNIISESFETSSEIKTSISLWDKFIVWVKKQFKTR